MLRKTVIWGASGHARVVADALRLAGGHEIIGFLDDVNPERTGSMFFGLPVLGGREAIKDLIRDGVTHAIIGFGDCQARLQLSEYVSSIGLSLTVAIHPRSVIGVDVPIGVGTMVGAGAVVDIGAWIGKNVILNTGCIICHDSVIKDGVHICPGVHLAANVSVGQGTWVGIGSTVINGIRIGAGSYLGAGSVVVKDIPDGVLAYGVPARPIRKVDHPVSGGQVISPHVSLGKSHTPMDLDY